MPITDITDTLNAQNDTKNQIEAAQTCRAILEDWTNNLEEFYAKFQAAIDEAKFDSVPADVKAVLTAWWGILQKARADIQKNVDIMAVYKWRPEAGVEAIK